MAYVKRSFVVVLSAGWLAPMWLATWLFVDFSQIEGWPHLLGQAPGNSFEWFGLIKGCLGLGFAWLAAVIAYWSWVATALVDRGRAA